MNSKLVKENLKTFFKQLNNEEIIQMDKLLVRFQKAYTTMNEAEMKLSHEEAVSYIRKLEKKTNNSILSSVDGSYRAALFGLCGIFTKMKDNMREKMKPTMLTKNFENMFQAKSWFEANPTIEAKRISVDSSTRYGLFANHANISSVQIACIDHKVPMKYTYGVDEIENTSLFIKGNASKYIDQWKREHADYEVVHYVSISNERRNSSFISLGFDTSRVEHVKCVILWRKLRVNNAV